MKYSVVLKFLALLLCACCLLISVGSACGIIALVEAGLYTTDVETLRTEQEAYEFYHAAIRIVELYALKNHSGLPEAVGQAYFRDTLPPDNGDSWYYTIADSDGQVLDSNTDPAVIRDAKTYELPVMGTYPVVLEHKLLSPTDGTEPFYTNVHRPAGAESEYLYLEEWRYEDKEGMHRYTLGIRNTPLYTVTLYLTPENVQQDDTWLWELAEFGHAHRYHAIWILGGSLLLFAALYVYLCCAAGRAPKREEIRPGGLNRLPLDLYGAAVGFAIPCAAVGCWELIRWHFIHFDPQWLLLAAVCAIGFLACLMVVGFLFALAAQLKMKDFYWAKHSLICMTLVFTWKLMGHFLRLLRRALPRFLAGLWRLVKGLLLFVRKLLSVIGGFLRKLLQRLWRGLQRIAQLLPLTWQWLLTGFVMIAILLCTIGSRHAGAEFFGIVICIGIIAYGAHCFGILLESTRRMSQGDLEVQVDDSLLLGSFQEYAQGLNALAGVAVESAKKQMQSERMKAELVTNVSHDIKTPLTSIINYVDLLQKAETQQQAEEYLEVLSRQSLRLKKLIEDLMELSKASTGNLPVNLTCVNTTEAISQALGEFSEKLEQAGLTPVFLPPEVPLNVIADGRLVWRVFSNLLSNAVKYAMPGTRLYIDIAKVNDEVLISLKNISKEPLNLSAEELMERFVRGDASRNTEGSGLGLNITKSLMELQKGRLQLMVDGDLFKATMVFPAQR